MFTRISLAMVLGSALLILPSWTFRGFAAQDRKSQKDEEELPQPPKSGKKQSKEEEEQSQKTRHKAVPKVGDEDMEEKAAARGGPPRVADLEAEAERAKSPAAQELFRSLARPHDLLRTPSDRVWNVSPIKEYVGSSPSFSGEITIQYLDDKLKPINKPFTIRRGEVRNIESYEEFALKQVDAFLAKSSLPKLEGLQESEKALSAVIRFHESAREQGTRSGPGWNEVERALQAKLQTVQLDQLRALTDAKDWNGAFDVATRLAEKYRQNKDVQVEVARLLSVHAEQALNSANYGEARRRLLVLEEQFPNSPQLEQVREGLRKRAAAILEEAKQLEESKRSKEALAKLELAESIYPQLPGLHGTLLRLSNKFPVLYVGVHDLPENMSPGTASTDSEKQAVELMFESLIKLTYSPASGQRYECGLAGEMPQLVPLGRRFPLTRGARWSTGGLVTAPDVSRSVALLREPKWHGYIKEWADLLEQGTRVEDSFHINLTLHQGFIDPLSLMDFKVMPQDLQRIDAEEFGRSPVGSGPFMLSREKSKPGEDVAFVANPYYEGRQGKNGLPKIREIHFVQSRNPREDFQDGKRLHLLLDLPTRLFKELQTAGDIQLKTYRNRRIYFLAVNHRKSMLKNLALRRAIGHGINREEILNNVFRLGIPNLHRPLNGPYPPSSWAAKPGLPADPYSAELAAAQANKATAELGTMGKIKLKFPSDDPAAAEACNSIVRQLQDIKIAVELAPRSPKELRQDVEDSHDYELAYYSYDYPSQAYWLWPLFDPQATEKGNYLGYQNNDELESFFRKTMTHRDPAIVQELTRQIHAVVYAEIPLIPLWLPVPHIAWHTSLSPEGNIDPPRFFTDVERWSLEKR